MTERRWLVVESVVADVRYALRGLRHAPGYAATVVLTLALGLAAVGSMMAVVDSVLLRPVPLPDSGRLAMVSLRARDGAPVLLTQEQEEALRRSSRLLESVGGYATLAQAVGTPDGNGFGLEAAVSPALFKTLGVQPRMGRLLGEGDTGRSVVVVSAEFWRERLQADPAVLGSTLKVNGVMRTVVGVLPDGLEFPQGTAAQAIFVPLESSEAMPFASNVQTLVRLRKGVTQAQARDEVQSLYAAMTPGTQKRVEMVSYARFLTGDTSSALWALLGGCGVMLLIACANAANLQLTRTMGRLGEIQVRSMLGASFGRLLQQIATESLVVSGLGAGLGLGATAVLVRAARTDYGRSFARFNELAIQPEAVVACAGLAILVGLLATVAPVLEVRRRTRLEGGGDRATRRSQVPALLVGAQIALTAVLLLSAGLFLRTFRALEDVPLGFDPHGVATLVVSPENQQQDPEISRLETRRLLERFRTLPGIEAVAMQTSLPFSSFYMTLNGTTDVTGRAFQEGDAAFYSFVSGDFVQASGIRLLRGRGFTEGDRLGTEQVAVVNQAFVNHFLGGRDPLSASLTSHIEPTDKPGDTPPLPGLFRIVGVVENEIQGGSLGAAMQPMVYVDFEQLPRNSMLAPALGMWPQFAVRSTLPEEVVERELRAAVKQTAPTMIVMQVGSMEGAIANSLEQRRLALRLVSGFGVVALSLAGIGLYGILSYAVAQRRKEIGIRMALGATRASAMQLVLRAAASMLASGLLLGAAVSWPASRLLRSYLFGVRALDPATLAAVVGVLVGICLLAAAIPAWRAASVEPMEALRQE